MTHEELQVIRNRLNAAARGPWKLYKQVDGPDMLIETNEYKRTPLIKPLGKITTAEALEAERRAAEAQPPGTPLPKTYGGTAISDVLFIANAHADVFRLLMAVEKLMNRESADISIQEINEIKQRCEEATSGPWRSFVEPRDMWGGANFIMTGENNEHGDGIYFSWVTTEDQDFIAAARQDIPRLLNEIGTRGTLTVDNGDNGGG